jgi:hypothetical protein
VALSWVFVDESDHLLVRVEGEWQVQSMLKLIDAMGGRCRDRGYSRVLVDARAVRGPLSEPDRYLAGARIASELKSTRVAVLAAPNATITGFGANVAARRGGQLYPTKDIDEARQWLFAPE